MFEVKLHELGTVSESEYTRVVCVCNFNGKWVFSKNKKRGGWEIPGGHIEPKEDWLSAAKRELFEETGAVKIKIEPICLYSVSSYAILCYAEIEEIGELPDYEIEKVGYFDDIPDDLTFPDTHKVLFEKVLEVKGYK